VCYAEPQHPPSTTYVRRSPRLQTLSLLSFHQLEEQTYLSAACSDTSHYFSREQTQFGLLLHRGTHTSQLNRKVGGQRAARQQNRRTAYELSMTSQTTRGHKRKLADNSSGPSPSREPSSSAVEAEVSRSASVGSLSWACLSLNSPCTCCSHVVHTDYFTRPSGQALASAGAAWQSARVCLPQMPLQVKGLIQTIRDLSRRTVEKIDRPALRKAAHALADICKGGGCWCMGTAAAVLEGHSATCMVVDADKVPFLCLHAPFMAVHGMFRHC
jgi:hypothetical protein